MPPSDARPSLLWIDDETSSSHSEVRFLSLQGFSVDCAITGCDGLAMARTAKYDGILLDLKLPDLPGLSILATLRAEKITTPVLVLTGFADLESARVAGRFGAMGFKSKPVFLDDLEIAVRELVQQPPSIDTDTARQLAETAESGDELRAGFAAQATLLEQLHRLSQGLAGAERGSVAGALIRAIANQALPMLPFLGCSAALRRLVAFDQAESLRAQASHAQSQILDALAKPGLVDARVVTAIESVRAGAARHQRTTIEVIAERIRLSAPHLGRLIKDETGFDFTEWRTAFILRPGLSALLETNQDVKQIACAALGFRHLSQFDNEFHRFFGLTPTQFRQIRRHRD